MRRVLGVFVGGKSARMGRPKGLLPAPAGDPWAGVPLVRRAIELGRACGRMGGRIGGRIGGSVDGRIGGSVDGIEVVLVGDASPYRALRLGVREVADEPAGIGPVGGLCALLSIADVAVALACDMPFVQLEDLDALFSRPSAAPVLAPRRAEDAPWEPLLARYDAARVLPAVRASIAAGERGFQRLFARLDVERFVPSTPHALDDWDEPADVGA